MSNLNSLPDDVLKLIMHHVPAKDRLTSWCLVNSRLHAAAVAATDALTLGALSYQYPHINVTVPSPERAQAALEWLALCGQHMTSLVFHSFPQTLQQLPCPSLLELTVQFRCSVQLGPTAAHPGVLSGCTSLTKLDMLCNVLDSRGGAEVCACLSSLVHLQHLKMQPRIDQVESLFIEGLSSGTLPCLQHLTYLKVFDLSVENILELGALTNLQQLFLKAPHGVTLGPRSVPGLLLPDSLTQLPLSSPVEAAMLSCVPTGLKELALCCSVDGPAEGPGSLLSCIALLPPLTGLHISVESGGTGWPPSGPAYSALTASTQLVKLGVNTHVLPVGVWPFVLSATFLHLTDLCVDYQHVYDDFALPGAWGAADVACLVSCCPNLCKLDGGAMQHGPHVSELHKLTALTDVHLHYGPSDAPTSVEETMQGLAAVTQLRDVAVDMHDCVGAGYMPADFGREGDSEIY
jgi:hypothetical protein